MQAPPPLHADNDHLHARVRHNDRTLRRSAQRLSRIQAALQGADRVRLVARVGRRDAATRASAESEDGTVGGRNVPRKGGGGGLRVEGPGTEGVRGERII